MAKFSNVKVGDRLFSIQLGECVVYEVSERVNTFQARSVINKNHEYGYNTQGHRYDDDAYPSIFFPDEFPFQEEIKVVPAKIGYANLYADGSGKIFTTEEKARTDSVCMGYSKTKLPIIIEPEKRYRKVITWEEIKEEL